MYSVLLRAPAEKDISALPPPVRRRVIEALASLRDTPRPVGIRKLEAQGGYRLRLGDYRIVLEIDDESQRIFVVRVKHRKDVYRDL